MTIFIKQYTKSLLVAGILAVATVPASAAMMVTQEMECAAAQAQYAEKHLVYVKEEQSDIPDQAIPIYEGVPAANKDELACKKDSSPKPVFVPTKDNPQCEVAITCK